MKKDNLFIKFFIITIAMISTLSAKISYGSDLGVMGETYPIIEIDFMDFIKSRIDVMQQNGQWQLIQSRIKQDAIYYRDRPKKVEGITRTVEEKSWIFDPSITLDNDIKTSDGKLVVLAGTHVNPLNVISLSKTLLFYNSDDPDQVKWAISQDKKLKGHDKLILVNGSVLTQEKQFKRPIYFDQAGKLTMRFGITHVPAYVNQEGLALRIREVKL